MIDLHAHILSGLDDGAKTLEESIRMCWISYKDGIRTIVATPHTLNGLYQNDRLTILAKVEELNALIKEVRGREFGVEKPRCRIESSDRKLRTHHSELSLIVVPGADAHLCEKTLLQLDQGEATTIGDGGKYLFVEFPFQSIPYRTEEVLFRLMERGIIPIITHPERNLEVGQRPQRYYEMIRTGCLGQVTAMSLTGGFGPGIRRVAEKLLTNRLIHFIASDAHSTDGRPPILSEAVRAAGRIVGKEEAQKMVTEYPQAILEGQGPDVPDPLPFH